MLREALGPLFIVRAIPNHRIVSHLPEAARRRYLRAMAADGVISGSADIEVLSRGRCLQLELKRDAKAPIGDDQIAFADACRRAGCPHHFLWNLDAIFDAVRSWCVACGFEVPGVLNRLLGFSATTRE
jgi:hypothetical protein